MLHCYVLRTFDCVTVFVARFETCSVTRSTSISISISLSSTWLANSRPYETDFVKFELASEKTIEDNSGTLRTRIERTGPWITNLGQNGFGVNSGWVRAPKHIKPVIVFAHFVVFPHPLHQLTASDASSSGFWLDVSFSSLSLADWLSGGDEMMTSFAGGGVFKSTFVSSPIIFGFYLVCTPYLSGFSKIWKMRPEVSNYKPEVKRTGKVIYRILNRISVLKNGDITGYFSQKRKIWVIYMTHIEWVINQSGFVYIPSWWAIGLGFCPPPWPPPPPPPAAPDGPIWTGGWFIWFTDSLK